MEWHVNAMGIADEKRQILDLIEKLHPQAAVRSERRSIEEASGASSLRESISRRRQELLHLKDRRERLGLDLLEERLLGICQILEKRIAGIEALVKRDGSMVAQTFREDKPSETVAAPELDQIMPDLNVSNGIGEQVADGLRDPWSGPYEAPKANVKASHALSGRIEDGMLSDILQMISANAKTGIFSIEDEQKKIELYFRDGELYHAVADDMTGQSAFFAAMAMEVGSFFFGGTEELPDEKTIDGNTQFMILEALRQIDEQRGG